MANMRQKIKKVVRYNASLVILVLSGATLAQKLQLEEVVVTAQKRTESLQDVPISIAAVSGEIIDEAGLTNLEELTSYIPNVTINTAQVGSNVYIRGIGSGINAGFEQSVGIYVDGVYLGRSQQSRTPFVDVERVEILRGPQGILFGQNTVAGAISISTAKPGNEFEGSISALYDPEYSDLQLTGILSGPLSDSVSARLAVRSRDADGYFKNITNDEDEKQLDNLMLRGTLVWDISETIKMTFKAERSEFDSRGLVLEILKIDPTNPAQAAVFTNIGADYIRQGSNSLKGTPFAGTGPFVEDTDFSNNEMTNASLRFDWQLGDHTLTSITGYSGYDFQEIADGDSGPLALITGQYDETFDQYSQEFRLLSPTNNRLQYIVGAYFQKTDLNYIDNTDLSPLLTLSLNAVLPPVLAFTTQGFSSAVRMQQDSESWALFGQASYDLTEQLRLTLGLRYGQEEKEAQHNLSVRTVHKLGQSSSPHPNFRTVAAVLGINDHFFDRSRDESTFTPSINLQWRPNDDLMFYGGYSEGQKSGGFDARNSDATDRNFEFAEEQAKTIEIGAKTTFLGGSAELNAALFRTKYEDLQVSVFNGILGFNVQNAAEATSQGLELEGRWRLTENLSLRGWASWLNFEFDDYQNVGCTADQITSGACAAMGGVQDLSGKTNTYAPDFSTSISAEWQQPLSDTLNLGIVVDWLYTDEVHTAPDLDINGLQPSYTKLNARISIASDTWSLALVGRNLMDKTTISYAQDVPLNNGAHRAFVDPPRTIALEATYHF